MTRMRVAMAVLCVAAFAAGFATALALRPWSAPPARGPVSWLASELGLSAQQQQEMSKVWAEVGRDGPRDDGDRRRAIQKSRDEAIRQLVPPDRASELEKVYETYAQQMAELSAQRRLAFDRAVERTKALLTPAQRVKYDELLAKRSEWRHGGAARSAATAPASAPAPGTPSPMPHQSTPSAPDSR